MSDTLKVTGTIKQINPLEQVTEKFSKREFILTINETTQYPDHLTIQATNTKTSLLDGLNVGDKAEVFINLRGREYTKDGVVKYFNSIESWKINVTEKAVSAPAASSEPISDLPF